MIGAYAFFGRRQSFILPRDAGISLASIIVEGCQEYLTLYPKKTFSHSSQEQAKQLSQIAAGYRNYFNAAEITAITLMNQLIELARELHTNLAKIKKDGQNTLFDIVTKKADATVRAILKPHLDRHNEDIDNGPILDLLHAFYSKAEQDIQSIPSIKRPNGK